LLCLDALDERNDKHTVWIGGDFNIPEINWKDLDNIHVKENSKNADIHQEFIELTTNYVSEKASTSLLMES
jgi:hypothetical protein